ncbi:MAG: transglycosylase domain-containing protein [Actinomycetota bacterium]|nr:transglycosylase domain-containing protein [Actinomycetota bacterium]
MQVVFTFFKRIVRFALIMAMTIAILAGAVVLIAPQARRLVSAHRSDHARINLSPLAERSLIYDRNGTLLATLHLDQNRSQVPLRLVSTTVIQSIIATEDQHFYQHKGVNLRSVVRAATTNLDKGKISQGGSTITQQVVKNALVGNKRNFSRKMREAVLAVELEKQMTKRQILERYVNTVYFGNGAYGVQAASQVYFDKDASKLNWPEGALLASLISSPNQFDPFRHPAVSLGRRRLVFRRLVETHKLTPQAVSLYNGVPLPTTAHQPHQVHDYFVDEVKSRLLSDPQFGLGDTAAARYRAVFQGGLRIHTTFDPAAQLLAVQARNQSMLTVPGSAGDGTFPLPGIELKRSSPNYGKPNFGTEAMVSIEPGTGAVRVMVAGPGFDRSPYNLATSRHQPGSSMKSYVLATLFSSGYVPDDLVSGDSCVFPQTGNPSFYAVSGSAGVDTITGQTKRSSNCAFLRLGQIIGLDKVVDLAKRLGVTSRCPDSPCLDPRNVSLPLGTADISPFDMAAAYSVFANDGIRNAPYVVDRIEDRNGKVIYQHRPSPELVLAPQTARLVNQVLQANVQGGTGTNAQLRSGQPAAGKTGTTNDSKNLWFVGYTPQLATAVWMGSAGSSEAPMDFGQGEATGGRYAALTWGDFMNPLLTNTPIVPFAQPNPTRSGISLTEPVQIIARGPGGTKSIQTIVPGTPAPAPDPIATAQGFGSPGPTPSTSPGTGTGVLPPGGPGGTPSPTFRSANGQP